MKRRTFLTLLAATVSDRALAQATVVQTCGSVTLTPGSPHNVTIDVNGQSCQSGAASAPTTSTWSVSDAAINGMTLSNGGLTVSGNPGIWQTVRNTVSKTSGKLYIEFLYNSAVGQDIIGVANAGFNVALANAYLGSANYSVGIGTGNSGVLASSGFTVNYTTTPTISTNDVWALAVDFGTGNIWIAKNNVWINSSDPATGSLPIVSFIQATVGPLFAGVSIVSATTVTLQSTAASQTYAPPSGFTPWG